MARHVLFPFVTITLALASLVSAEAPASAGAALFAGETFVVDPGHGTRYPDGSELNVGAVGPHGVEEQIVTLAVAEDLAALLRSAGANVVLTRSYRRPYRTGTVLRLDNRARAALANKIGATAFVSIHADASTAPQQRGISVFWLRPNSLKLANAMRRELDGLQIGESEFRVRDLAVTSEARVPAVLVEIGFVSNPEQEHLLAAPAFQNRVAHALYDALAETYGR
jgi:N-acetylmuramoyl-L-alanine amidase